MKDDQINVRYNLSSLIGYWSAMSKILSQRLEFMLDNDNAYRLNDVSKYQLLRLCEDLKEAKRISDYVWENRMTEDFDSQTITKSKEIVRKQYTKNNYGRTISLDQEQKG